MSGECEKCGEHTLNCSCRKMISENSLDCLCLGLLRRIEDIGRAREILSGIMDMDVFDDLSKHNQYWESEHEKESDKLFEIRMKISHLQDGLGNLYEILSNEM